MNQIRLVESVWDSTKSVSYSTTSVQGDKGPTHFQHTLQRSWCKRMRHAERAGKRPTQKADSAEVQDNLHPSAAVLIAAIFFPGLEEGVLTFMCCTGHSMAEGFPVGERVCAEGCADERNATRHLRCELRRTDERCSV